MSATIPISLSKWKNSDNGKNRIFIFSWSGNIGTIAKKTVPYMSAGLTLSNAAQPGMKSIIPLYGGILMQEDRS